MQYCDIVVIGGGPAGLAAAIAARESGAQSVLILERDKELGGILNQCIHNGFGLHTFQEELTGPEYAARFIARAEELDIPYKLNTMVLAIGADKVVTAMNRTDGLFHIRARAVVLAMGCRERARGALNIPGFRPAGIYSAGTAQRLVNKEGFLPGREVVILGSGDIGLIMARRMTLEGAHVQVVAELMPYSGGLKRNIVQCLDDFGIPLKLSHTVVDIQGKERVEGVTLAAVDAHGKPMPGTEEHYTCDTLLLSVGLLPENELSRGMGVALSRVTGGPEVNESLETNLPGVFACGNVLHVHDLVDYVSEEAAAAGRSAAAFVREESEATAIKADAAGGGAAGSRAATGSQATAGGGAASGQATAGGGAETAAAQEEKTGGRVVRICPAGGVRYTVPSTIRVDHMPEKLTVRFRVGAVVRHCMVCTYFDQERVATRRRQVVAPGEMEQVVLKREDLLGHPALQTITICIETED